ncbi:MAG: cell division protein ZipA [Woeseia sp.]
MDGLRWLLLIAGLLVIAGVYLYSRRERMKAEKKSASQGQLESELPGDSRAAQSGLDPCAVSADEASRNVVAEEKIVTLRLVARDKGAFNGEDLVLSLRGIGLRHGKFGIFHRHEGTTEGAAVFSVASLVEPGSFDIPNIKEQKIPGVSIFMVLPGPMDGAQAFDLMMEAARALSQSLNAELLDESGSTLSIQRERYLREEIIRYQHGIMVA